MGPFPHHSSDRVFFFFFFAGFVLFLVGVVCSFLCSTRRDDDCEVLVDELTVANADTGSMVVVIVEVPCRTEGNAVSSGGVTRGASFDGNAAGTAGGRSASSFVFVQT